MNLENQTDMKIFKDKLINYNMKIKIFSVLIFLMFVNVFSLQFVAAQDTTSPEAILRLNPETNDLEIIGTDNLDKDVDVECVQENYVKTCTLTDNAKNTLILKLSYIEYRNKIYSRILSLKYDNGEIIPIPKGNNLCIRSSSDYIYQKLHTAKQVRVETFYDKSEDKSLIQIKEYKEKKEKFEEDGLVLIELRTDKGELGYDLLIPNIDFFYYSRDGKKIPLELSTEMIGVRFKEGVSLEEQEVIVEAEPNLKPFSERVEYPDLGLVAFMVKEGVREDDVLQTIDNLNEKEKVEFATPVFNPGQEIAPTNKFSVKFESSVTEEEIAAFNSANYVEVVEKLEWLQNGYILRVIEGSPLDNLQMANLYYESSLTTSSQPHFLGLYSPLATTTPDDTYFGEQRALDNTGQDPPEGTADADIDAPEGWDISTGSSDIIIAVLDTGVDLEHNDLVNKLVDGNDAYGQDNDPSPGAHWWNAHGTACDGLAAAETDNGIGIAGVAWDCMIMPIRVAVVGRASYLPG